MRAWGSEPRGNCVGIDARVIVASRCGHTGSRGYAGEVGGGAMCVTCAAGPHDNFIFSIRVRVLSAQSTGFKFGAVTSITVRGCTAPHSPQLQHRVIQVHRSQSIQTSYEAHAERLALIRPGRSGSQPFP